jgi:hypothetical protein
VPAQIFALEFDQIKGAEHRSSAVPAAFMAIHGL